MYGGGCTRLSARCGRKELFLTRRVGSILGRLSIPFLLIRGARYGVQPARDTIRKIHEYGHHRNGTLAWNRPYIYKLTCMSIYSFRERSSLPNKLAYEYHARLDNVTVHLVRLSGDPIVFSRPFKPIPPAWNLSCGYSYPVSSPILYIGH